MDDRVIDPVNERDYFPPPKPEPNTNPETGIRYGIISANTLHSNVIDEIQSIGTDIHYEELRTDIRERLGRALQDYISEGDVDILADEAFEMAGNNYQDDEPVHEFTLDGVTGRTTWLGGALLVYVFESPFTTHRGLCSPCVPNAVDLDSEFNDEGGYLSYDVPPEWRFEL